jgi:ureidoacrylate peracid hydrolase
MEPEILKDLRERIQPRHTALLIIDMQKDFCVDGMGTGRAGRDLSRTKAIIPRLAELRQAARDAGALVCHIGFWTLPGHMSDSGSWLAHRRRSTYSGDRIAVAGSEGAEFIDELTPEPDEVVIHKHRYSGFKGTDLDMLLRARDIRTCIVTGVSTNVCVESTLRDAFEHTYYVAVPADGTASWSEELGAGTLENVEHRFGLVTSCEEILEIWRGQNTAASGAASA